MEKPDVQRTYERYERDAQVLSELGRVLVSSPLAQIEVRLPKALAEQAVMAWNREEDQEVLLGKRPVSSEYNAIEPGRWL